MSLSFKHFAYCIVCVIIFGCILAVFGRVESGGNTGLKEIFASKFPEGKDEYKESSDFKAADAVLSTYKPEISCNESLVEGGIAHGTNVPLEELIVATEDEKGDGNVITLPFMNITVHEITDRDNNPIPGFAEGDSLAVFPKKGAYTLTVTAEYKKGCSSRKKLEVIVKK